MFQYVDAIRLLMAWCELRWGFDRSGLSNRLFADMRDGDGRLSSCRKAIRG
ncbi:hypothetical protein [Bradyrhizobium prioriisuperbiae]|uniref:hypothetical protein n=1 Tax=Bradyrhizobium prioriisuperbiae TaxID=2854389 RepID=UPI0028E8416A|nr:hypothetical protein [Bradyrhizobium prioritasuperba]